MIEQNWAIIIKFLALAAPLILAVGKLFYLANSLDRLVTLDNRINNLQKNLYHIIEVDDSSIKEFGPDSKVENISTPANNQTDYQPIKPRRNIYHA